MTNKLVSSLVLALMVLALSCADSNRVVSADNVSIAYHAQGSGSPALVFIHGWCCDHSYWDAQLAHFSGKHKVVAIDLAGHGDSGMNRSNWSIAAFGADVVAVVNKLGIERMVLIGHSMGGPVALEATQRLPGRVIGLVGADTFHDVDPTERPQEEVDKWLAAFSADFAGTATSFVRGMFVPASDSALVEKIVADMSSAPPEVGLGAIEATLDFMLNEQPGALRKAKVPVRCINSDKYPTDIEAGKKYASSFEVAVMAGVGHFVMNEDPETFNRLLEEIIEELIKSRGK
jgi:pimeloyl-ACP methyl ester carboxylesterase